MAATDQPEWHPNLNTSHAITGRYKRCATNDGARNDDGEEDELRVKALPNDRDLQEEIGLLDSFDGRRPAARVSQLRGQRETYDIL